MKTMLRSAVLGGLLAAAVAVPAAAQDGFALKGSYIYNRSTVEGATEVPGANGFGLGAEFVLPLGFGVGVSAYTGGRVRDFDVETSGVSVAADANYFFKLPLVPIAPYVGVHAGMGRYSRIDDSSPGTRPKDNLRQLGYQVGVRLPLLSVFGLDAQYRRMSSSLQTSQGSDLSRQQVLVGVTLF